MVLFFCGFDCFVAVGDEGFNVYAVSSGALTDAFKMWSHAAYAAEAVFSENFQNFGVVLNGVDDAGIFSKVILLNALNAKYFYFLPFGFYIIPYFAENKSCLRVTLVKNLCDIKNGQEILSKNYKNGCFLTLSGV